MFVTSLTTTATPISLMAVGETTGSGDQALFSTFDGTTGSNLGFDNGGANNMTMFAGAHLNDTATDNAFHVAIGVGNGAVNSSITIDNRSTVTGNAGTNGTGTEITVLANHGSSGGTNNTTGYFCEGGIVTGTAITTISTLHSNAATFYGTP